MLPVGKVPYNRHICNPNLPYRRWLFGGFEADKDECYAPASPSSSACRKGWWRRPPIPKLLMSTEPAAQATSLLCLGIGPMIRPWRLDPRYVLEDCYDEHLLAGTASHVDDIIKARLVMLTQRPTSAGTKVEGYSQLYVLPTQPFAVPTGDGPVMVPGLWIVYVLIPEEQLVRPLYICRATSSNSDWQRLAERALVHFHRANIHS